MFLWRAFPLYLEKINEPADIRDYTAEQRRILAREMRNVLIERTSLVGGHIGPNHRTPHSVRLTAR